MNESFRIVAAVEDEPHMLKALTRLLSSHGYRVEPYARGADLLAAIHLIPFDCVVLDLHMPELNGFDLMAVIKARGIHIPVVVITGKDEPNLEVRVSALGAHTLLLKPVDQEALLAAIGSATRSTPLEQHIPVKQGAHA